MNEATMRRLVHANNQSVNRRFVQSLGIVVPKVANDRRIPEERRVQERGNDDGHTGTEPTRRREVNCWIKKRMTAQFP